MIMDVGLTLSKIDVGLSVKGRRASGHIEIEYNSLKCNFGLYIILKVNAY